MAFLEWNDDDFPILRDESEQEDHESTESDALLDGLMISIRESSLQASIDYYTAADDGLPDVDDVIVTARRFADYLLNGE